jgi:D-alanine-D-alanine ligase
MTQLVDATTGAHLWSERYDRPAAEFFAVHDEVVAQIVGTLTGYSGPLARAGTETARRKRPESLRAYDYYLLAKTPYIRHDAAGMVEARQLLLKALALDPGLVRAWEVLAWTHFRNAFNGWGDDPEASWQAFHDAAGKAASVDPLNGGAHVVLGMSHFFKGEVEQGAVAWDRALALSPNDANVLRPIGAQLATALGLDRANQGLELAERAMRLDPLHPASWRARWLRGLLRRAAREGDRGVQAEAQPSLRPSRLPGDELRAARAVGGGARRGRGGRARQAGVLRGEARGQRLLPAGRERSRSTRSRRIVHAGAMRPPELRRFVILFEPEAACRARLTARGMPAETAAEVAFYLAQATDFAALVDPVAAAFAPLGVEMACRPLDPPEAWLPLLTGPDRSHTLVWCLTDGFAWYRGSFVSSLAALLDVPQFGSPPAAQHLCQDKFRCLAVAQALGVRTPATVLVEDGEPVSPLGVLPAGAPLFVKPNTLGAKLGIDRDSRAAGLDEALALARRVHARYGDHALIQGYVPGRDVRVSCMDLGGPGPPPFGVYEVATGTATGFPTLGDSRRLTTLKAAGDADGIAVPLRNLRDDPAAGRIEEAARRVARALSLRDYFSFDFRVDETGVPWFLEFEVCPAVTIYDFLTYLRDAHGTDLPGALARAAPLAHARRVAALDRPEGSAR